MARAAHLRTVTLALLACTQTSAHVSADSKDAVVRGPSAQTSANPPGDSGPAVISARRSDYGGGSFTPRSLPRLAVRGRGLVQTGGGGSDDTPFFWAADTAWNMLIKANASEAHEYFAQRRAQVGMWR